MITPERLATIRRLFEAALDERREHRREFVENAAGDDADIRTRVLRMLEAHDLPPVYLDRPAALGLGNELPAGEQRVFQPGRILAGRFEILELVARGGMGEVYRAYDRKLHRDVALKVMPGGTPAFGGPHIDFEEEARAASALHHPNIAVVHDLLEEEGVQYLAMEFVRGKTLADEIPSQGMDIKRALDCAIQIAEGLSAAHAAGIVHRDMKPGNVMIAADGRVKILDFGIAARLQVEGSSCIAAGTPAYMAPEQARGLAADARSDVFGFGCVFYEMLTGRRAFGRESNADTLRAIQHEEPGDFKYLRARSSATLERIIRKCLQKDMRDRFQSVEEVAAALRSYESSSWRKTRGARNGLFLLALVLIGGGVWVLRNPQGASQPHAELRAVPFTSFPGSEECPSLSPDGTSVAFVWKGYEQDNDDIYVQRLGSRTPVRLTTNPESDYAPAWSPDGRRIAFVRQNDRRGLVLIIPATGGPERSITSLNCTGAYSPMVSWSPDGRWLVFGDRPGIEGPCNLFLVSTETGERRQLTAPTAGMGDRTPAFSSDGRSIAFSRSVLDTVSALWLLPLNEDYTPAGEVRRLTRNSGWVTEPAWSANGESIIYSTGEVYNLRLWRVRADGREPPEPLALPGASNMKPTISRRGGALMYVTSTVDMNVWEAQLQTRSPAALHQVTASTRIDTSAAISPDGASIAFASNRSGYWEIWVCDRNGSSARQLTELRGTLTIAPAWSPDGRSIAFDSRVEGQADVYEVLASGGAPRKVTNHSANDILPSYSQDGRLLYFTSSRTGRYEIWKVPLSGAMQQPTQITREGALAPVQAADGQSLFHLGLDYVLHRISASGDDPVLQIAPFAPNFAVAPEGIYYMGPGERQGVPWVIQFFDFRTRSSVTVAELQKDVHRGLTLAPDGKSLLFTQIDQQDSDLMLVGEVPW